MSRKRTLRQCDCGAVVPWLDRTHEDTPEHVAALIERWGDWEWSAFRAELDNGLGWARGESMELGRADHADVMRVVDELVRGRRKKETSRG